MTILLWVCLFVFIIVCIVLTFLILIQADKGGGISGAIGGSIGGASQLLGTQDTANFLTKGTMIFGGTFFALCIAISLIISARHHSENKSILEARADKLQQTAPAAALGGKPSIGIEKPGVQSQPAATVTPVTA